MTAFAGAADLQARWRPLTDAETERANVLLEDASVWLLAWFPDLQARIDAGTLDAAIPVMVACSMVKRAMLDSDGMSADQTQRTAGPFSESFQRSFSNPDGNLYLTAREEQLLRGSTSQPQAVSMMSPGL